MIIFTLLIIINNNNKQPLVLVRFKNKIQD